MKYIPSGGRTAVGPKHRSPAPSTSTCSAPPTTSRASAAHTSASVQALAPPGTPTRAAKPSTSPDGIGYVGRRGGAIQEIRPGDVVYIEPDEEHWHGATPDRFMAHVAIQEADENGQVVTWGNHVTDDEYQALKTHLDTGRQDHDRSAFEAR